MYLLRDVKNVGLPLHHLLFSNQQYDHSSIAFNLLLVAMLIISGLTLPSFE
jgi:hypothetical protein